jgi:hypothetical protein
MAWFFTKEGNRQGCHHRRENLSGVSDDSRWNVYGDNYQLATCYLCQQGQNRIGASRLVAGSKHCIHDQFGTL